MLDNTLPLHTSLTPVVGSKVKDKIFPESSHIAYEIKGKRAEQHSSKTFDLMHTPGLFGSVKRSDIEIVLIGVF